MTLRVPLCLSALLALTLACGDSSTSTSDTTGGTDSETSTDSESSTDPTTAGSETGNTDPTGSGSDSDSNATEVTTDSTDSLTADSTDPSVSTTDPSDSDATTEGATGHCEDACAKILECTDDFDSIDECLAECEDFVSTADSPECVDAIDVYNQCLADVSCDAFMNDPCPEETVVVVDDVCFGGTTEECAAGGFSDGMQMCGFEYTCPEEDYLMECGPEKCVCSYNGEDAGECASNNICEAQPEDPIEAMNACCGFDL